MRRHALAAEPHVTWAAQLVSCVREVPSRAQLFAAADGNSDADWRWARGTRGLGNQSPTAGLMPPSDSEESDSEESGSEESEADALGEAMALLQHDFSLASRGAPSPQGAAWGEAAGWSLLERGSVNRGEDGSEAAAAAEPSLYVCALSSSSAAGTLPNYLSELCVVTCATLFSHGFHAPADHSNLLPQLCRYQSRDEALRVDARVIDRRG